MTDTELSETVLSLEKEIEDIETKINKFKQQADALRKRIRFYKKEDARRRKWAEKHGS